MINESYMDMTMGCNNKVYCAALRVIVALIVVRNTYGSQKNKNNIRVVLFDNQGYYVTGTY